MTQTPYNDLSSEDILSAHISGLQHDINKIQQVLEMNTGTLNGHALVPVTDQEDPSLRYRIYEGTVRNWLSNPAPIIYRNGVTVDSSEYEISPAHGVVVFNQQQNSNDNFTVDATHITNQSAKLTTIEKSISTNQINISTNQQEISSLQEEVSNLDVSESGFGQEFPLDPTIRPEIANVMPGYMENHLTYSADILQAGDTIDAFPVFVKTPTRITQMKVDISGASVASTMHMGIYTDANAAPHKLLGETGTFSSVAGQENIISLQTPVVLEVGLYWICRYQSAGIYIHGHQRDTEIMITISNATPLNGSGTAVGIRTIGGAVDVSSGLPETFPVIDGTSAEYLTRADIGTIFALKA